MANVAHETFHGPGGSEVEAGLRHFRPGARVWVLPPRFRNEDEHVEVIGFHRGGHTRLINFVVFRRHLENFRAKGVFSPTVVTAREHGYWNHDLVWCCPTSAQPWVDRWNALRAGLPCEDYPAWPARRRWPARYRESAPWPDCPCPHEAASP